MSKVCHWTNKICVHTNSECDTRVLLTEGKKGRYIHVLFSYFLYMRNVVLKCNTS